jgi:hypothetical protein
MPRVRDFNPEALTPFSTPRLAVRWHNRIWLENRVWQFIILLPRWLLVGSTREPICTARDERLLEELLQRDFGGYTSGPLFVHGVGRRGVQFETNIHRQITVLAARGRTTKRFFHILRAELEASSGEEQILILRQDLVIC